MESTLSTDLAALFGTLHQHDVSYLLVGGIALLRYIDGRNTDDIDLILAVESLDKIPELVVHDRNPEAARAQFRSVRVDLLFTSNPVFRLALEQFATAHRFSDTTVRCATVEGLVLLKLYALPSLYRQGHLQRAALYETDIAMLCLEHDPAMQSILTTLRPFVSEGDRLELARIADEIEQRVSAMRKRSNGSEASAPRP